MGCIKHCQLPKAISKRRKWNAKGIITKTLMLNTLRCSGACSRWKGWPRQVSFSTISILNFIFNAGEAEIQERYQAMRLSEREEYDGALSGKL